MKRQLGLIGLTFLFAVIGCSNKNPAPATEPVSEPQADTQYTDPYATAEQTNSNLWDTTLANDAAAASPTPTPSASPVASSVPGYPAQWGCLTGNQPVQPLSSSGSTPPWYGSGSASMSPFCFDDGFGDSFGEDDLYGAGLGGFNRMQACYQTVMSMAPQYCTAGYDVNQVFQMSQMALVRCFRIILKQQMRMAHWNRPQMEAYQENDQSFYLLLQLFSQDDDDKK